MKKKNKNILIATGGTGGHIFPSISLAKFLSKNYNLQIVSDNRGLKFLQNTENMKVKIINSGTIFKKNLFNILLGTLKIITAFVQSWSMLNWEQDLCSFAQNMLTIHNIIITYCIAGN